jgi:hypothetical protein
VLAGRAGPAHSTHNLNLIRGYQTRINAVLRAFVEAQERRQR